MPSETFNITWHIIAEDQYFDLNIYTDPVGAVDSQATSQISQDHRYNL